MINLALDVFCKSAFSPLIPKDRNYTPLCSLENPAQRTMIQLFLDAEDEADDFAGPARLSIGFMQSVIELFTVPGDLVMDWTVGVGNTFWAGEYCGRFVIGVESRELFEKEARRAVADVLKRVDRKAPESVPVNPFVTSNVDDDDDEDINFGASAGNTPGSESQTTTRLGE